MKDVLKDFVHKKSNFFDLPDGESGVVKFLGAEAVTTHYQGKAVDSIRYSLEVNGKLMDWDRSSREFAKQMTNFEVGDVLKIKREGKGNKTKYEIQKIK